MNEQDAKTISGQIIAKAVEFGACKAGIANIAQLKTSPSHTISGKLEEFSGVGTKEGDGRKKGEVIWPETARSAVVIAVAHPSEEPDLDFWVRGLKGGTRGNARLMSIFARLSEWIETRYDITCMKIPYHIEYGGVFMKDTAILGGLGCIGKNNILITPEHGPRVRLRVMLLDRELPSTGALDFDPCADCAEYCRTACPQNAFGKKIYTSKDLGQEILPGRTGVYSRKNCNLQMELNKENGREVPIPETDKNGMEVRYCRVCELACPVGKD